MRFSFKNTFEGVILPVGFSLAVMRSVVGGRPTGVTLDKKDIKKLIKNPEYLTELYSILMDSATKKAKKPL